MRSLGWGPDLVGLVSLREDQETAGVPPQREKAGGDTWGESLAVAKKRGLSETSPAHG